MPPTSCPKPIALVGRGAIARWPADRQEGPIHNVERGDPLLRGSRRGCSLGGFARSALCEPLALAVYREDVDVVGEAVEEGGV